MSLYIGNKKYCAIKKSNVNNTDILITSNGNYTPSEEYSGFGLVRVQVPEPILDELTVTPKTTAQTLNPLNDGFSVVNVDPVTSSIDSNILAANIKKGISILGVTGTLEFTTETLTVSPKTTVQSFTPTKDGYSKVSVNAVTSAIDSNILATNIRKDVKILGVTGTAVISNETTRNITINGTYDAPAPYTGFSSVVVDVKVEHEALDITPSTEEQTFTAADEYHGYSPVTVAAVTSAIDSNIVASNIKKGITILGVTGTVIELNGQTRTETLTSTAGATYTPATGYNAITSIKVTPKNQDVTITPSTSKQTKTVASGYSGHGTITTNAVTAAIDSNIKAANIKSGVSILGVTGTVTELKGQTKTITANGTYTPDTGYNGLTSVTVDVDTVKNQDKTITKNGTYTADEGYTGLGTVTVNINTVNNTTLTATPKTTAQTFTPASPYTGYSKVTVNAVTSSIDSNIVAANIKKGTTILGVTGTLESSKVQASKTLTVGSSTATKTTISPDSGYDGIASVVVDLSWIENQLKALNAGDSTTTSAKLQAKTVSVDGTSASVAVTPDSGYDGLSKVTVNLTALNQKIKDLQGQVIDTKLDDIIGGTGNAFATDATYIREYVCYYYVDLTKVVLNNAETIGAAAFGHSGLTTLTIQTNKVCTLASTTALDGTPIANGQGTIYVPSSLVDSYKADSNWSVYASQIKAIS